MIGPEPEPRPGGSERAYFQIARYSYHCPTCRRAIRPGSACLVVIEDPGTWPTAVHRYHGSDGSSPCVAAWLRFMASEIEPAAYRFLLRDVFVQEDP